MPNVTIGCLLFHQLFAQALYAGTSIAPVMLILNLLRCILCCSITWFVNMHILQIKFTKELPCTSRLMALFDDVVVPSSWKLML
jgi:hypothetical protein